MGSAGSPLEQLETPCVLLYQDRLRGNIRLVQERARAHGLRVRPHVKTHKCLEVAALQTEAGAVGVTASKTDEALVFVEGGIGSVTVAYPLVVDSKLDRLIAACAARGTELRLMADSRVGVEALSRAAARQGTVVDVFLKLDVGLNRCGLKEGDPLLLELARHIETDPALRLQGVLAHPGHAYAARDIAALREIAGEEQRRLTGARQQIEAIGIAVPEVSAGSTPTVLASESFEGITEIRPGNYAFMDRTPLGLGLIGPERIALSVLATVISANADYYIIDAGSKTLSSDKGAQGIVDVEGFALVYPMERFQNPAAELVLQRVSEEHGFVARGGVDLAVGSRVRLVPNHSCAVANLADQYLVVRDDRVVDQWPVHARGRVR